MFENFKTYVLFIVAHVVIGILIYTIPFTAKVYGFGMILVGLFYVIKNRNANHEVLLASGYIVGAEVLLRMTNGNPFYEFSKYGVTMFILIGMYFKGFSKNAIPYWIFLALLIPGVVVAAYTLNHDTPIRKTISFNISGPLCLGIASLYTYMREISFKQLQNIMLATGLPIITMTIYLVLYTPSIRDVITGTGSSYETSGGFGPNQVSTILGLGMFIFFSRLMLSSPSKRFLLINLLIAVIISYRGLVTFSRGGIITAMFMLVVLLFITYIRVNQHGRSKMRLIFIFFALALFGIWSYSSIETGGLIGKRYANQDAAGRVKESQFTGRENILASEIRYFLDNPVFGIGVAKGTELRKDATGRSVLSHNEVSRMLAEHGSFGIMALMILFLTPLILYFDNKQHIFLICFLAFWLLTINHAAMRVAAPAFIYALSILKIVSNYGEASPVIHRE